MVGCRSSHLGRGLGWLVSLAAMHRMQAEGRERAVLQTDDFRLPAIRSYQRLGYRPLLFSEDHRRRWLAVVKELGWPELPGDWAATLSSPLATLPPTR
jgi:mycothiol synthase